MRKWVVEIDKKTNKQTKNKKETKKESKKRKNQKPLTNLTDDTDKWLVIIWFILYVDAIFMEDPVTLGAAHHHTPRVALKAVPIVAVWLFLQMGKGEGERRREHSSINQSSLLIHFIIILVMWDLCICMQCKFMSYMMYFLMMAFIYMRPLINNNNKNINTTTIKILIIIITIIIKDMLLPN